MAVTGAPSNLPIFVVSPKVWERAAVLHKIAMFPHKSFEDIRDEVLVKDVEVVEGGEIFRN